MITFILDKTVSINKNYTSIFLILEETVDDVTTIKQIEQRISRETDVSDYLASLTEKLLSDLFESAETPGETAQKALLERKQLKESYIRSQASKQSLQSLMALREAMRLTSIQAGTLDTTYTALKQSVEKYLDTAIPNGRGVTWLDNFDWHLAIYYDTTRALILTDIQKRMFLQCLAIWMSHAISDITLQTDIV
jgi:hypothetical protein